MLVMTKSRSPKTVCICIFFCVSGIGDFAGSSVRKIYLFHFIAKYPLLVCLFQRLLLSSSFQQKGFHLFWTSFAKDMSFPVCEIEVDTFPFGVYNILLDNDVSLHNLVVLVVTIPSSPRLSKTEFICRSYGVLILLFDLPRRWSGVSGSHRSLRPNRPESPASSFRCRMPCCGALLDWGPEAPRRWSGVSVPSESLVQGTRNLWPQVFSSLLHLCGAVLDRGPEHPRRVSGVSGLAGLSGPLDRNLRPAPMTRSTRSLAGISGPGRSLRPT